MQLAIISDFAALQKGGPAYAVRTILPYASQWNEYKVIWLCFDRTVLTDFVHLQREYPAVRFVFGRTQSMHLVAETLARRETNIVHVHGLWSAANLAGALLSIRSPCRLVVSPHGMLDEWALRKSRLRKQVALSTYAGRLLRECRAVHALNTRERSDILRLCPGAEVRVISNPVATPQSINTPSSNRPFALYLGRLDVKKNVDVLIQAWVAQHKTQPLRNAELIIAGTGAAGYVCHLQNLATQANARIRFVGHVEGQAKESLLTECTCLVLPSSSEGQPIAVMEALVRGCLVLMSRQCNLGAFLERGLSLDCGTTVSSVSQALTAAFAHQGGESQSRKATTIQAAGEFLAHRVALQYRALYNTVGE